MGGLRRAMYVVLGINAIPGITVLSYLLMGPECMEGIGHCIDSMTSALFFGWGCMCFLATVGGVLIASFHDLIDE